MSHVFKKIDADAVNADEPLDAFILQGVDSNLAAARENRLSRASMTWPADNRPSIGSHRTVAYALATWPVKVGVTQVAIDVRHTVVNAPVHIGLAKLDGQGRYDISRGDLTEVAAGAETRTLTTDVTAFQGRDVDLFLLVYSDIASSPAPESKVISAGSGPSMINRSLIILPNGHGITQFTNTGDRWLVEYEESTSGGSTFDEGDQFPDPRTVIDMTLPSGATRIHCWPWVTPAELLAAWVAGTYKITVSTLGHTTLQGISIYDSVISADPDRQGVYLPGLSPAAPRIAELYARGRDIFSDHLRIHHAGANYEIASGISLWDRSVKLDTPPTYQVIGTAWAGGYPSSRINGGSARDKVGLVVSGWVFAVDAHRPYTDTIDLDIRASVYDELAGAWTDNVTNGAAVVTEVRVWNPDRLLAEDERSGALIVHPDTGSAAAIHYLRGAIDGEGHPRVLTPFSVGVEDSSFSGSADRMLRLEVRTSETRGDWIEDVRVHVYGLTVYERPGVYGV